LTLSIARTIFKGTLLNSLQVTTEVYFAVLQLERLASRRLDAPD